VGSFFWPVRFLLPVCRLSWLLYTFNIYAHFSSHFSQQILMTGIWYSVFGHKLHIGMPYCGKHFWDPYMRIFLSKYWWQKSVILSQASYRYPILWEAFFDPSDSYFLFADLVGFYTHLTYMHIFRRIFLSKYWW
jgi:hypothetical protein